MKPTTTILGLGAVVGLAMAVAASPVSPAKSRLDKVVSLGEHWYGEELNIKDLKGRVVLYEFWGLN